jgi:sulfopyruvate decarboxylase TPP-binding subunit
MRGEWSEFNPWQMPMSRATQPALEAMGVRVYRAETQGEVADIVAAACNMAFEADQQVAVLLSQRMLGKKIW